MRDSYKHLTFICIIILTSTATWVSAQENSALKNIFGKLATYTNINEPEKVYLQTDKDFYTNGETIWFKTYLLNGVTHLYSGKSSVIYVELVDWKGNTVLQRKLFVGTEGASGDIEIPDKIEEGAYVLRAYTKYMLNDQEPIFFQKEINIWAQRLTSNSTPTTKKSKEKKRRKDKPEKEIIESGTKRPIVQFFPEGGDLVTGLECVLGMKITDEKGNGIALEGKIFDQQGNLTAIFRTYEFGLGKTYFIMEPGTKYYAKIEIEGNTEKYDIPEPIAKGYGLQVLNMGEYFRIRISSNIKNGLKGSVLLGHMRGDVILKQRLNPKDENNIVVKLVASKLQDGIAHFTLFTESGEPVCERIIFVENPKNELNLSMVTNQFNYNLRDKVNVDLAVVDDKGKSVSGDFSLSVVTNNGVENETENIKSWLLLNSDLGGTIANPNYFFDEEVKGRKYMLDLLMLTHGWRRFTWQSFNAQKVGRKLPFPPEKGIVISGNTTAFNNRHQPEKALTTLNILAQDVHQSKETTNAQGKFRFGPFFFQDSVETIINAKSLSKQKNKDLAIHLDAPFPKILVKNVVRRSIKQSTTIYAKPYLEKTKLKKLADFKYDKKVTKLKEVVVQSKTKTREELINEELDTRTLYGNARDRLFPDSIPWMQASNSILDIVRLVPGVQVSGSFPNQSVQIRGAANFGGPISPLFLLDGMPVSADFIQTMPVFDVLFVDVLKGPAAAIYGMRAGGGVIGIYTKRGDEFTGIQKQYPGVANFTVPGFYKTRKFYSPNYAVPDSIHKKPDFRTTLHWEPNISISEKESAEIEFYTGDTDGEYFIRVEGMTHGGIPISGHHSISVVDEDSSKF